MVKWVSLSDWLAFLARIWGFENPRLLRDRPSDWAAWVAKIIAGVACRFMRVYTGIERRCEQVAARALLGREGMILCAVYAVECSNGHAGQSFQTGLPFRQESGGLKTPGY